ncbi:MAG: hypothetical protein IPJ89_04085 [Candidatus Iainarchaeum archaeon]|uniref:Uncharacterized protein n=1 Tax=Candidatus Iainarchaeum sp. TaxID=3101447 RepID=A0A7T9DJ72_9ARCH|nr:MAG: hypothetical protein IPJ89_04085 [Candidatus Diapherotrites archaeon]
MRPSAQLHAIRKFGRTFMDSFPDKIIRNTHGTVRININFSANESGIAIATMDGSGDMRKHLCGHVRIGFEPQTLIVEAIQGHFGRKNNIDQVNAVLGKPWANYALELAEQHARQCGLQRVKIASPRTNYWFNHPQVLKKVKDFEWEYAEVTDANEKEALQRQILGFYAIIAKKMGYKKQGDYYVKEL